MTYITWQRELDKYLGELTQSEREEAYAYFAEMYADKRDAGVSEDDILEEFGAPYDAAKRILAERSERAAQTARPDQSQKTEQTAQPSPGGVSVDAKYANGQRQPSAGSKVGTVFLTILLAFCCCALALIPVSMAITGLRNVIGGIVGIAIKDFSGTVGMAVIGRGILVIGAATMLSAPVCLLCSYIWTNYKKWRK